MRSEAGDLAVAGCVQRNTRDNTGEFRAVALHNAERPFRVKEIFKIPGITFGLSLASPTTNFYFGGSTEVLRNIQCVYGFNVSNISKLAVPSGTVGVGSTAPTVQSFSKGGFIGFTFNISGFIQGLFGAGSKSPI